MNQAIPIFCHKKLGIFLCKFRERMKGESALENSLYRFFMMVSVFVMAFLGELSTVRSESPSEPEVAVLPPVVVTATRIEVPRGDVAASVTVIDSEMIETKQWRTVVDALRSVPGLDIAQTGGPGGTASAFIRGGNPAHTLVLIDGVQVNSPTLGQYNFADLTTDNIERIEVIRGPQSTLYGADAVGGVVQIFTKTGSGDLSGNLTMESGSFDSHRETVNLQGSRDGVEYAVSASRFDTNGFSRTQVGTERDGYENTTVSSRLALNFSKTARLDWNARFSEARSDLDESFPIGDNAATQENIAFNSALAFSSQILDVWTHKLSVGFQQEDSKGRDPADLANFNNFKIETRGQQYEWQHDVDLGAYSHLTLGYEHEILEGQNHSAPGFDKVLRNNAGYALHQLRVAPVIFNLGLRHDDNSRFGGKTTYKSEFAYLHDATNSKLRAALGTGFHAPTLNDLYFPGFGNPDVKPEKSRSFEFGFEQRWMDDAAYFSLTYFQTRVKDLMVFVDQDGDINTFDSRPENVEKSRIEGWEAETAWPVAPKTTLSLNYTFTDTQNKSTGAELSRRPKHKGSASIAFDPDGGLYLSLDMRYVGKRFNDTANRTRLSDYTVFNLAGSYDLSQSVQIFGRIENLLDREYQEVQHFGTAGFSAYGGVKVSF